jgi:hypothetical protein
MIVMDSPSPIFMDVRTLLQTSAPRPNRAWFGYFLATGVLAIFAMAVMGNRSQQAQEAVEGLGTVTMLALLIAMTLTNYFHARARRIELVRLEAAEELVQLRRWPQAALLLQSLLSRPTRSPLSQLRALVYFSAVLARFHRFDDVITIDEHLLETMPLDAAAQHMVKLTRATSLLREDRLFDADRAISDLRRSPQSSESGGLALLEIYRDVKTGHPTEALEIFAKKQDLLRRQLGHRLADVYVLMAKAHDLLNQPAEAAGAYATATLLAPAVELWRRYPEIADLAGKYPQSPAPAEVVG